MLLNPRPRCNSHALAALPHVHECGVVSRSFAALAAQIPETATLSCGRRLLGKLASGTEIAIMPTRTTIGAVRPPGLRQWMRDFKDVACGADYWAATTIVTASFFWGRKPSPDALVLNSGPIAWARDQGVRDC